MSASSQAQAVRALAGPAAEEVGLVVEDVTVTPAGRRRVLRVTVDLPPEKTGGVPMDAVAAASRGIAAALDAADPMGGQPYVLEVSSPGVDRPLTSRAHWSRARTRRVSVALAGGGTAEGRLTAVDEAGLELDEPAGTRLAWDEVRSGRVLVEFSRPGDDPGDDEADDEADDVDGAEGAGDEEDEEVEV